MSVLVDIWWSFDDFSQGSTSESVLRRTLMLAAPSEVLRRRCRKTDFLRCFKGGASIDRKFPANGQIVGFHVFFLVLFHGFLIFGAVMQRSIHLKLHIILLHQVCPHPFSPLHNETFLVISCGVRLVLTKLHSNTGSPDRWQSSLARKIGSTQPGCQ